MTEKSKKSTDQIRRFLIENRNVRGQIVTLDKSVKTMLSKHEYPWAVESLLAQSCVAVNLLSSTLKYEGRIMLQARGEGDIKLLVAESTHEHQIRGIAQWQPKKINSDAINRLLGPGAQMAITIEPTGGERYQGIVALENDNLAQCLEAYFMQSEQLATRVWIYEHNGNYAGLLLQQMPSDGGDREADWEHVQQLASTLTAEELVELPHEDSLYRLFHQEDVRVYQPVEVAFSCSCTRERTASALVSVGREELEELLKERGEIAVDCQFCNESYVYDGIDIAMLFEDAAPTSKRPQ